MSYKSINEMLYQGHRKVANNTNLRRVPEVTISEISLPMHIVMTLHGNVIARFFSSYFHLYSSNWHTPITKNRLNLAIRLATAATQPLPVLYTHPLPVVYQKGSIWYYGNYDKGDPAFYEGITINYAGRVLM